MSYKSRRKSWASSWKGEVEGRLQGGTRKRLTYEEDFSEELEWQRLWEIFDESQKWIQDYLEDPEMTFKPNTENWR